MKALFAQLEILHLRHTGMARSVVDSVPPLTNRIPGFLE